MLASGNLHSQHLRSGPTMSGSLLKSMGQRLLGCSSGTRAAVPGLASRRQLPTACSGSVGGRAVCSAAATPTEAAPEASPADGNGSIQQPTKSMAYPFTEIEAKWQAHWEEHQTFRTPDFKDLDTSKPKFYALDMFPYPR